MTDDEIKEIVEGIEARHGTRIVCAAMSNLIRRSVILVGIDADVHGLPKHGTLKWTIARVNEINDWLDRRLKERKKNADQCRHGKGGMFSCRCEIFERLLKRYPRATFSEFAVEPCPFFKERRNKNEGKEIRDGEDSRQEG